MYNNKRSSYKSNSFKNRGRFGSSRGNGDRKSSYGGSSFGVDQYTKQGRGRFRNKTMPVSELIRVVEQTKILKQNQDNTVFEAKNTIQSLPISYQLKKNILEKGYTVLTPIQDQAIPAILAGRDLIGIANTGTGKTAAFLIPLIEKVTKNRKEKVLIITPVRELSLQIADEFHLFSKFLNINSALCIGGANIYKQKAALRNNPNFVIGTPGRLKDLIRQNALDLSQFNNVVLDETDQMVDIGFVAEIKYFISLLPQNRMSLFFSATISAKVTEILNSFVQNPVTVSVKKQDTAVNVDQEIVRIENGHKKIDVLHELLKKPGFDKVLVFGTTKWSIQKLTEELISRGHKADSIHGDKGQGQRQRVLGQFRRDEIKILLATDVASRGLDIKGVSHVINFDLPEDYDHYIHRIGRTGRADKRGTALTFVEGR